MKTVLRAIKHLEKLSEERNVSLAEAIRMLGRKSIGGRSHLINRRAYRPTLPSSTR